MRLGARSARGFGGVARTGGAGLGRERAQPGLAGRAGGRGEHPAPRALARDVPGGGRTSTAADLDRPRADRPPSGGAGGRRGRTAARSGQGAGAVGAPAARAGAHARRRPGVARGCRWQTSGPRGDHGRPGAARRPGGSHDPAPPAGASARRRWGPRERRGDRRGPARRRRGGRRRGPMVGRPARPARHLAPALAGQRLDRPVSPLADPASAVSSNGPAGEPLRPTTVPPCRPRGPSSTSVHARSAAPC